MIFVVLPKIIRILISTRNHVVTAGFPTLAFWDTKMGRGKCCFIISGRTPRLYRILVNVNISHKITHSISELTLPISAEPKGLMAQDYFDLIQV